MNSSRSADVVRHGEDLLQVEFAHGPWRDALTALGYTPGLASPERPSQFGLPTALDRAVRTFYLLGKHGTIHVYGALVRVRPGQDPRDALDEAREAVGHAFVRRGGHAVVLFTTDWQTVEVAALDVKTTPDGLTPVWTRVVVPTHASWETVAKGLRVAPGEDEYEAMDVIRAHLAFARRDPAPPPPVVRMAEVHDPQAGSWGLALDAAQRATLYHFDGEAWHPRAVGTWTDAADPRRAGTRAPSLGVRVGWDALLTTDALRALPALLAQLGRSASLPEEEIVIAVVLHDATVKIESYDREAVLLASQWPTGTSTVGWQDVAPSQEPVAPDAAGVWRREYQARDASVARRIVQAVGQRLQQQTEFNRSPRGREMADRVFIYRVQSTPLSMSPAAAREDAPPLLPARLQAFLDTFMPMQRGRVQATLLRDARSKWGVTPLHVLVENEVAAGARVQSVRVRDKKAEKVAEERAEFLQRRVPHGNPHHPDTQVFNKLRRDLKEGIFRDERRLVAPEGSFFDEEALTKTGMDYAVALTPKPNRRPVRGRR